MTTTTPFDEALAVRDRLGVVDRTGVLAQLAGPAAARAGLSATVSTFPPVELRREADRVDLLLLGPRELTDAGLRRAARYATAHPATVLVGVGVPPDGPDRTALRAHGIHHAVRGEPTVTKLAAALRRAAEDLAILRAETVDLLPEPRLTSDDRVADVEGGTVITVTAAAGGCGKTFLATNLAALLARAERRVLLVDLDLQFGTVAAALRLRHPYSLYDGLYDGHGRALPADDLEDHLGELVAPGPGGIDVLTAPRDPALADHVTARDVGRLLDIARARYDHVVVDTPPVLDERALAAIDRSSTVAVVTTLDVPALQNLTVLLDTLRRLRVDGNALRLVLNRVEPDIGVDIAQAQEIFTQRFVAVIPHDRAVSRSVSGGTVLVDSEPRSPAAKQVVAAAAALLPAVLDAVPMGGRISLLHRLVFVRPPGATPMEVDGEAV